MSVADLSTHLDVLRSALHGAVARVRGVETKADVVVTVRDGLQAGSRRRLRLARMRFGAGEDGDLVLLDPGAADEHGTVRFERSVFGTLATVQAIDGPVVAGGRPCPPGQTVSGLVLPLDLRIGATTVRFAAGRGSDGAAPGFWARLRRDPVMTLAVALTVLLAVGLLAETGRGAVGYLVSANGARADLVVEADAPAPPDWHGAATDMVAELGLESQLAVEAMDGGMLRINGTLPPAKMVLLRDMQRWYDGQRAAPVAVWNVRRQGLLPDLPPVAAVRLSDPAELILGSGRVVGLGAVLADGWAVAEIGPEGYVLDRAGERIDVPYRPAL